MNILSPADQDHRASFYKPEDYQFASGLTPYGRIKTQGRGFQLLCWLLKPSKRQK